MAKAKTVSLETFTLTQEQFNVLLKLRSLLDNASDTLDEIDGSDGNLFQIGKAVGDATGDIINAYNELGELIVSINPKVEDEGSDDNVWTFA